MTDKKPNGFCSTHGNSYHPAAQSFCPQCYPTHKKPMTVEETASNCVWIKPGFNCIARWPQDIEPLVKEALLSFAAQEVEKATKPLVETMKEMESALKLGCKLIHQDFCCHGDPHGDTEECYAQELHRAINTFRAKYGDKK